MADKSYAGCMQDIDRFRDKVNINARKIIREYDQRMKESADFSLTAEADKKICDMVKKEAVKTLGKVHKTSSVDMKNGYNLKDN